MLIELDPVSIVSSMVVQKAFSSCFRWIDQVVLIF